jgi:NAD-dependent SIR2 family protein deacetylase
VVLFGEKLNFDFQDSAEDFEKCDLLIIMGTSLVVEP